MAGQKTMTQNAGSSLRFHSTSFHSGSETGLAAFLGLIARRSGKGPADVTGMWCGHLKSHLMGGTNLREAQ